jgi:cold-inducible RNA-binding protein
MEANASRRSLLKRKRVLMSQKIYVGNLAWSSTETQIRELFAQYGTVTSVNMITDRETGRSRGFAFVEMEGGAEQAIRALDKTDLDGRPLNVNEARPRAEGAGQGGRGRW